MLVSVKPGQIALDADVGTVGILVERDGERPDQSDDGVLGEPVDRIERDRAEPGHRGRDHDVAGAPFDHAGDHSAGTEHDAVDVDRHDAPIRLIGQLDERRS